MLNHNDRIALIAQVFKRGQKSVIVPLMQADDWLIKHIEHALQPRADLTGKANPLAFSTRKRAELRARVRYSSPTLFRNPSRSRISFKMARRWPLLFAQLVWHGFAPVKGLFDGHLHHLASMQPGDFDGQGLCAQTIPAASAAGAVVLIALELFADPIAVGLAVAALHIGDDTFKAARHLIHPPAFVIAKQDFFLTRSVQKNLLHFFRQVLPFGEGLNA